jgi:hypothetical protein
MVNRVGDEIPPRVGADQIQFNQPDGLGLIRDVVDCEETLCAVQALAPEGEDRFTEMERVLVLIGDNSLRGLRTSAKCPDPNPASQVINELAS